ncbi:hypothetical protein FS837_008876 [Tulasnella sp. UAMH 9824]|nr:hypothetical protein FS837_008876 [Tulasnella sp. UAMH 9824]
MSPGSTGAKLRHSNSSDIELLTAIRQGLQLDEEDGFSDGKEFSGLVAVEHILSEVLGLPCSWTPSNDFEAGGARSGSRPTQASLSDSDDETWVEEWEPKDLSRWQVSFAVRILNELRALGPLDPSVRRVNMRQRLEERLAVPEDTPDAEALPDVLSSSTDHGTDMFKPVQEDAAIPCPISSLPVELLQDVFHHARSSGKEIRIPLTLSYVSPHFRSVALGTPSLWTAIDNLLPLPIVELYIARSGEEQLSFRMWADLVACMSVSQINDWVGILRQSSRRIRIMEVYGYDAMSFVRWKNSLLQSGVDFPSLGKMELVISESGQRGSGGPNCPRWTSFPGLQDLWIQGYPADGWTDISDPFPPGLRRLKFSKGSKIPIRIMLKALKDLLHLRVLSLDYCSLEPSLALVHGEDITMTSLEELEVARMSTAAIKVLTLHLHTPNLTSLSVTYPVDRGLNIANLLIPFTKTHAQLRSLHIKECGMNKKEWTSTLQNVAHLNRLVIRASDLRDEDLRGLGLALVPIIPNLTHLTLENELQLTTSLVEQIVRTHPNLVSVILRWWDASNVSKASVAAISRLVPYVEIQTFGDTEDEVDANGDGEEDQWDDSYWEGSDFSEDDGWLSGDEAVVKGDERPVRMGHLSV